MAAEIPSSGNIGIDISIALITGGAVTTWLTLLINMLAKKREEYVDITKEKISKISKVETICMRIGSSLGIIAGYLNKKKMEDDDYLNCIYYIAMYLFFWSKLVKNYGYIQLDNIYSETIIQELAEYLTLKLYQIVGREATIALGEMVDDDTSLSSFLEDRKVYKDLNSLVDNFKKRLKESTDKGEMAEHALWFYYLLSVELNLMYRLFYGEDHVRDFYKTHSLPDGLLKHLSEKHPEYYQRLDKFKLL